MELELFVIVDRKASAIMGPVMPLRSPEEAKRIFRGIVADKSTLPGQYPADFDLVRVGSIDPREMTVVGDVPSVVLKGRDAAEET